MLLVRKGDEDVVGPSDEAGLRILALSTTMGTGGWVVGWRFLPLDELLLTRRGREGVAWRRSRNGGGGRVNAAVGAAGVAMEERRSKDCLPCRARVELPLLRCPCPCPPAVSLLDLCRVVVVVVLGAEGICACAAGGGERLIVPLPRGCGCGCWTWCRLPSR